MLDRSQFVEELIRQSAERLGQHGISITEEQILETLKMFLETNKTNEEIKQIITNKEQSLIEQNKLNKQQITVIRQITDLKVPNIGITLNNQQIDLMMIASANTPSELNEALRSITNIKTTIRVLELTEEDFIQVRQHIFDMYINSLENRNDYLKNKGLLLQKKVEYLHESGILSEEEFQQLRVILKENRDTNRIIEEINRTFGDKANLIYKIIRQRNPIEKDGIKSTDLEGYRNLYNEIIKSFDSITIDEEAKYYGVTLQNDTFDFSNLQKSLDFAKKNNKKVRLNALCFYMDCPEEIYQLETGQGKRLAKEKLSSYVSAITEYVRDYEKENGVVVRSIDVFNELLNRYPMKGNPPYAYRGDIEQVDKNNPNFDNIAAGWQKHLTIEDLCDIISIARQNLPNTEFVFNDANLEDPTKVPYFLEMIKRIQEYEKKNNIKLIDAIGTQMHVNTNLTKSQIIQMFRDLSTLNLPIEITEFDMCVTRDKLKTLTEKDIEILKQQKLNELCECVEEMKDEAKIQGVTIWSVNDEHNFMLSIENERLIERGEEPLETVYGGYFGKDMRPRQLQKKFQDFNFHTHTQRCGHASLESDREYVLKARENGITTLGFSDHIPNPKIDFQNDNDRMHLDDTDEYLESIERLREEYQDMEILSSFEAEYDSKKEQFIGSLAARVDYMILGQHYVPGVNAKANPNYPLEYAKVVVDAIESGIFDIIAHPDIFMQYENTMNSEDERQLFLENAVQASKIICSKAKEFNIPLEINLGGIEKTKDGISPYPSYLFWKVASENENLVLYGVDAHYSNQFNRMVQNKQLAERMLKGLTFNFVPEDYNPKEARTMNQKLQETYRIRQEQTTTYETNLAQMILEKITKNISDDDFDPCAFALFSEQVLQNMYLESQNTQQEISNRKLSEIEKIASDQNMDSNTQRILLENAKRSIERSSETLNLQNGFLNLLSQKITSSIEMGCTTKKDIQTRTLQLIESSTTKDPVKKNNLNRTIQASIGEQSKEKPKQLIKESTNSRPSNPQNKGYSNIILTILTGGIIGIILGLILAFM